MMSFSYQQEIVRRVAGLFALADQLAQARRPVAKLTLAERLEGKS